MNELRAFKVKVVLAMIIAFLVFVAITPWAAWKQENVSVVTCPAKEGEGIGWVAAKDILAAGTIRLGQERPVKVAAALYGDEVLIRVWENNGPQQNPVFSPEEMGIIFQNSEGQPVWLIITGGGDGGSATCR